MPKDSHPATINISLNRVLQQESKLIRFMYHDSSTSSQKNATSLFHCVFRCTHKRIMAQSLSTTQSSIITNKYARPESHTHTAQHPSITTPEKSKWPKELQIISQQTRRQQIKPSIYSSGTVEKTTGNMVPCKYSGKIKIRTYFDGKGNKTRQGLNMVSSTFY